MVVFFVTSLMIDNGKKSVKKYNKIKKKKIDKELSNKVETNEERQTNEERRRRLLMSQEEYIEETKEDDGSNYDIESLIF